MHFQFTAEQEKFRREIKDFLKGNLPPGWLDRSKDEDAADEEEGGEGKDQVAQQLAKKMSARGWLTARWPKEYGGLGWTPMEQLIFAEEMTRHKVPRPYTLDAAIMNIGPTIAVHGSEEQKKQWLPGIARADDRWCQLFSEPNAGSDLAGLQTRAVEDGDFFVVNGTKIWTSGAHKARWGTLIARTDPEAPKHKGISYMVVDMKTPGITYRPLVNINDVHSFNQVFLDSGRVPESNRVGQTNRGWCVATTTLSNERSFIRHVLLSIEYFDEVVGVAKQGIGSYRPLKGNPALRHKLADLAVELRVARLLAYRVAWLQTYGDPSYESSVSKLYASEMCQRLAQLVMEGLGQYGQIKAHSKWAIIRGKAEKLYLTHRGTTIGGGTSEIQRSVIARRGLGLGQAA